LRNGRELAEYRVDPAIVRGEVEHRCDGLPSNEGFDALGVEFDDSHSALFSSPA
jgi:hypothetical protein